MFLCSLTSLPKDFTKKRRSIARPRLFEFSITSEDVGQPLKVEDDLALVKQRVHDISVEFVERFSRGLASYVEHVRHLEGLPQRYSFWFGEKFVPNYMSCVKVSEDGSITFDSERWTSSGYTDDLFWEIEFGGQVLPPSGLWRALQWDLDEASDALKIEFPAV